MTDTPKSEAKPKHDKMKDDLWFFDRGCECSYVPTHQYQCDFCQASSDWRTQTDLVEQVNDLCSEHQELLTKHERVLKALEVAESALEVYAMTNETFPEYGTVAKETLAQIESIKNGGGDESAS